MVGHNTFRALVVIIMVLVVTSLGCAPLLNPEMFKRNKLKRVIPPLAGVVAGSLTGGFLLAGVSQYERKSAEILEEFAGAVDCPTLTGPRSPACEARDAAKGRAEVFHELAGSSLALSCTSALALAGLVAVAFNDYPVTVRPTRGGLAVEW